MFKRPEDEVKTAFDAMIMRTFQMMDDQPEYTEEYASMLEAVTKAYELRSKEKLNLAAAAPIVAHLAGLVLILQHERAHVIATKAFGLLKRIV